MKHSVRFTGTIAGSILLPSSKSISNRALVLNALGQSPFPVENLSDCDDTKLMLAAFRSDDELLDIGAAGTSMRFLTAYYSQVEGTRVITGTERMKNRPIRILVDALRALGAQIEYLEKEGFPPLRIRGRQLEGGAISLNGSVSSQYISALMMIAPRMKQGLRLQLTGEIVSVPYIQMTIRMMEAYGVCPEWNGSDLLIPHQPYSPVPFRVESDWSAASYWYEMIALSEIGTEILLEGLLDDSTQGDAGGREVFEQLGVSTVFNERGALLRKTHSPVLSLKYDFVNMPDLAQTFVVVCCLLNIPFRFSGLQSLRIKETDRITALQAELRKLGYVIRDEADSILEWDGTLCEAQDRPAIATYEDHRMAMAFAPAAMVLPEIVIEEPGVVSKSYPAYWEDLMKSGFCW